MGKKYVQKVPSQFAEIYIEVGFVALVVVFAFMAMSTIGADLEGSGEEASAAEGASGMLVLLIAGAGLLYGSTTLMATAEGKRAVETLRFGVIGKGPREHEFYSGSTRKLSHGDAGIHTTGLAAVVMGGNKNFKFLEDEYPHDHDYSRDMFREGEESDRARDARTLSAHYRREKQEREEKEKNIRVQLAKEQQQQQPQPATIPGIQMFAAPYNPYIQAPLMPAMAAPMPIQHPPSAVMSSQKSQGAPKSDFEGSRFDPAFLLPPYPAGHPLRDESPYAMVLFFAIVAWLALLEGMRRQYFVGSDGKPRKPNQKEINIVEIVRLAGSLLLGTLTYLWIRQVLDNNPGFGSQWVAFAVAIGAFGLGYFGSERVVQPARETVTVPRVCLAWSYDKFVKDTDYLIYEEEIMRKCAYGDRPVRSRFEEYYDAFWYYLYFWLSILVFVIFLAVGLGPGVGAGAFLVAIFPAILIPYYGQELPWKPSQKSEAQRALGRLTQKLAVDCKQECVSYCKDTLTRLMEKAQRECKE